MELEVGEVVADLDFGRDYYGARYLATWAAVVDTAAEGSADLVAVDLAAADLVGLAGVVRAAAERVAVGNMRCGDQNIEVLRSALGDTVNLRFEMVRRSNRQ